MKQYKNDQIIVHWFPEICTHPGTCLRLLPQVFNLEHRPWIDVDAASPEEIIHAVDNCPSGALRYSLPEGSDVDPNIACSIGNINYKRIASGPVRVVVSENGPLFVEGPTLVFDCKGDLIKEDCKMAFCTCGHTKNHPFCDGTHRKFNWKPEQK